MSFSIASSAAAVPASDYRLESGPGNAAGLPPTVQVNISSFNDLGEFMFANGFFGLPQDQVMTLMTMPPKEAAQNPEVAGDISRLMFLVARLRDLDELKSNVENNNKTGYQNVMTVSDKSTQWQFAGNWQELENKAWQWQGANAQFLLPTLLRPVDANGIMAGGPVAVPADWDSNKTSQAKVLDLVNQQIDNLKGQLQQLWGGVAARSGLEQHIQRIDAMLRTAAPASNVASMDLEAQIYMVMLERAQIQETQLREQMAQVKQRNLQQKDLQAIVEVLNSITAGKKDDEVLTAAINNAKVTLEASGNATQYSLRDAMNYFSISPQNGEKTSHVKVVIESVKGRLDTLNNSQQQDTLRLQMLNGRRNESYEMPANLLKRMQDTRNSIIGNLR